MAMSREIVDPFGRQFSCDSMDRFGDDLCQLIVGYLPFEDKTRLEGVAKQWRRVMDYNTIKTLRIDKRFARDSYRLNREYKALELELSENLVPKLVQKQLLANCPDVQSLKCSSFSVFSDRSDDFLPKLKSLKTRIDTNNVSLLVDFVHKHKELKSLSFTTYTVSPKQLIDVLNAVSLLQDINVLEISFCPNSSEDQPINIDRQLQQIGRNCRQLKRFYLGIDRNIKIEGNVWRNLVEFQALESLELNLKTTVDQSIALMGLKKNIKRICFTSLVAREEIFANIHQIVPNLKSFTFNTNTEVTDKLLDSLSHLNHLKEIFIHSFNKKPKITESGVNRLLDKCPQLTRLNVRNLFC